MKKHTAGPWRWWACRETKSASNDYIQIAAGLNHVAQIKITSITEHDLRLMVAAPDLLNALNTWLEQYSGEEYEDCPEVVQTRFAIAKATGAE